MNEVTTVDDTAAFRGRLAKWLVLLSSGGVLLLGAVVLIGAAVSPSKDVTLHDAAQLIFTAILPLLGTWVGTVLAFYFTKDSLEAASRTTAQLVRSVSSKLASTPLSSHIIQIKDAVKAEIPSGKTIDDLTIADIKKKFEEKIGNSQKISRLLFVDVKSACVAIIHRSIWLEMLDAGAAAKPNAIDPTKGNLGELLALPYEVATKTTFKAFVTNTLSYVAQTSTVADAKVAMESTPHCQDVIVTSTGKASEAMVGWITNVEITRLSQG